MSDVPPGCNAPDAVFGGIEGAFVGLAFAVALNPLVNSNPVGWCVGVGIIVGAFAKTQLPRENYQRRCQDLNAMRRQRRQ
jgi:hypothetical protein